MTKEETIVKGYAERFSLPAERMKIARSRRLFISSSYGEFQGMFDFAVKELGFSILCTISGLDEGDNLGIVYHLANTDGIVLNLKTAVPKSQPEIATVTSTFPSALLYEREMEDLLGLKVAGLPEGGRHYPLPDDWPKGQYPLRKDWKGKVPDKCEETSNG